MSQATIVELETGKFRVTGYVDAQNMFGAMLRKGFTCVVRSRDGQNWTLEELSIDK
jgi:hypothetical protein